MRSDAGKSDLQLSTDDGSVATSSLPKGVRQRSKRRDSVNKTVKCLQELAQMYRLCGRHAEAIEAAKSAAKQSPNDSSKRAMLIDLLLEEGHHESAIKEAQEWLEKDPDSYSALEALAIAYWHKGDLHASSRTLTRLLSRYPYDLQSRYQRAIVYQYIRYWKGAREDLEQICRMASDEETVTMAEKALKFLDKTQIRKIVNMIFDQPDFRRDFKQNPEETLAKNGFALSQDGWNVIRFLDNDWNNVEPELESGITPFD